MNTDCCKKCHKYSCEHFLVGGKRICPGSKFKEEMVEMTEEEFNEWHGSKA